MKKKLIIGLPSLLSLSFFTLFPEYFFTISIIYVLVVVVLITYNVYGLMLQKALSECLALILLMTGYLIFNDDLLVLNFSNFNSSIINDFFAFFTKILICLASSFYFLIVSNHLKEQKLTSFEYLLIFLFAILGLLLMCSSNDLLTAYLAIELSSLAFYILTSFRKFSSYSVESGVTYFITGAISSAFFLLGCSFIYGLTGSINFSDFHDLFECSGMYFYPHYLFYDFSDLKEENLWLLVYLAMTLDLNQFFSLNELFNYSFLEFGLSLLLFSLFIKLALAPFHLWSLDVYENAPTSSTVFFAVITKLSIFVLLIRICYQSFFSLKSCWQFYSLWIGIFSIFIGSFGGLKQRKLKTLLAYSSTSHMGYALIAFSTSTFEGIQMLLFYMFIYMISGLSFWYIFMLLRLKKKYVENKYNKELSDLALLKKSNKALAFSLALTMFSIAGIPPLVGFLAKMSVFLSVVGISFYFVALISVLCSVISTFYYIRIIKILYFESILVGKLYYPINSTKTIILSFLIFLLVFFFLNPSIIYLINYKVILNLL